MKEDLVRALRRLASRDYQLRYIVNGTAKEYVLADELLEDLDALVLRARRPEFVATLSDTQWAALDDLNRYMTEHGDKLLSAPSRETFFQQLADGRAWNDVRARAALALMALGGSLVDPIE